MASPFTSLTCTVRHDGARLLVWTMLPGVSIPDRAGLRLESRLGGGDWEVIAERLLGLCCHLDSRRLGPGKWRRVLYRLRLTDEALGTDWLSDEVGPCTVSGDSALASVRAVEAKLSQGIEESGCSGSLLKRRTSGERCPRCLSSAGHPADEHCRVCLGTGFVGGYFPGIPLTVLKRGVSRSEAPSPLGRVEAETVEAECLAYPWIAVRDVWAEESSGRRYMINAATPSSSWRHHDVTLRLRLDLLEQGDVLHSAQADDRVWRTGESPDAWDPLNPFGAPADDRHRIRRWAR